MRQSFSEDVENGRLTTGAQATIHGQRFGAFCIRDPETRTLLNIIVSSGEDWAGCGLPGAPWEHVSVSTMLRCPLWSEMCWVKKLFFDDDECVIEYHPAKSAYVNTHGNCLHLWRPSLTPIPMPPKGCV